MTNESWEELAAKALNLGIQVFINKQNTLENYVDVKSHLEEINKFCELNNIDKKTAYFEVEEDSGSGRAYISYQVRRSINDLKLDIQYRTNQAAALEAQERDTLKRLKLKYETQAASA